MEKPNTTRRRRKWLVQGYQNRLCGPIMRSNCCCDSHSTTRRVSCKKRKHKQVVRHYCCCYECRRVQRSKARGRGVGQWRHGNWKCADSPSTRNCRGCGGHGFRRRWAEAELRSSPQSFVNLLNVFVSSLAFVSWFRMLLLTAALLH